MFPLDKLKQIHGVNIDILLLNITVMKQGRKEQDDWCQLKVNN